MKKLSLTLVVLFAITLNVFATGLSKPILYSPEDQVMQQDTVNFTIQWIQATDTTGENVTYDLYLSPDPNPVLFRTDLDPSVNGYYNGTANEIIIENTLDINGTSYAGGYYLNYADTLKYNTTYYWKIIAKNTSGETTESETFTFTTYNTPPEKPTLLSPTDGEINVSSTPTLTWNKSNDIDGDTTTYCIYLKKEGESFQYLASTGTDTSYTITSPLNDFTTYYWRVYAIDGTTNETNCSSSSSFTIENYINDAPVINALNAPSNGAKNLGFYPIVFKWTATEIDNEPLKYDIYADQNTTPTTLIAENITADSLTYTFDQYGSYYWRVVVKDTSGLSDTSAVYSFSCWEQAPDFSPEMVDVKNNNFDMGTADSIYYWTSYFCDGRATTMEITNEYPQHNVTLDDYQIGKYEITNKQYCQFLNTLLAGSNLDIVESSNKHRIKSFPYRDVAIDGTPLCQVFDMTRSLTDRDSIAYEEVYDSPIIWNGTDFHVDTSNTNYNNHPVRFMYYDGADKFASWIGKDYRLPTEAEWENAAMGGNQNQGYKYSGSNNYNEVAVHADDPCTSTVQEMTKPVGSLLANELGIYDMSGNVEEICSDYYDPSYYTNSPTHNPENQTANILGHVLRDGPFNLYDSVYFRVKIRNYLGVYKYIETAGFRLAKTIDYYTVTFNDWDGTTLKTDTVEYEEAATAPADPTRTGYTFTGWDKDFSNITSDLTVTAQYSINTYEITFTITDGTNVIANAGISFNGNTYTSDANGQAIISNVANGSYSYSVSATGYETASGQLVVNGADVSETLTLTASVTPSYSVNFTVTNGTNSISSATVVFNGSTYTSDTNGKISISGIENGTYNYTVSATGYDDATGTISVNNADVSENVILSASTYEITFTITDGTNVIANAGISFNGTTYTSDANGQAIISNVANGSYSYTVTAIGYKDAIGTITANNAHVSESVIMTIKTYSVSFNDWDGTALKTETVEYGKNATAPIAPTRTGYTFTGWDIDFSSVKSDLTIIAQYTPITSGDIDLCPNPVQDYLTIKVNEENKCETEIQIFDIKGNLMYRVPYNKIQKIDLSFLRSGIYFVKIGNTTKKVIKL